MRVEINEHNQAEVYCEPEEKTCIACRNEEAQFYYYCEFDRLLYCGQCNIKRKWACSKYEHSHFMVASINKKKTGEE